MLRWTAELGRAYALYFTDGGSVGLDLDGAPGRFDVRWIDIGTGDWGKRDTIQGGSVVTVSAPARGHGCSCSPSCFGGGSR